MVKAAKIHNGISIPAGNTPQPLWQRVILLVVLGYEAAGCLLGGGLLTAMPDGSIMQMPVSIMHGAFQTFLVPGIILFGLGIINTIAFFTVLRKHHLSWLWASVAMWGLAIWFWVEIAILQELHWLHAMWGLPVALGLAMTLSFFRKNTIQLALLFCGILASMLYAVINVIVPLQWPSYNVASQTVSELSAIGAPTQILWNVLCTPYTLLMIAFAIGFWWSAGASRLLRISAALMFGYGMLNILWPFSPMHLREALAVGGNTASDTRHIILGSATELLFLVSLAITAFALGKPFRIYSIVTFLVLLVFGILTFLDAPAVAANKPTPFSGIWERINIGAFLLWIVVLARVLIKRIRVEQQNSSR